MCVLDEIKNHAKQYCPTEFSNFGWKNRSVAAHFACAGSRQKRKPFWLCFRSLKLAPFFLAHPDKFWRYARWVWQVQATCMLPQKKRSSCWFEVCKSPRPLQNCVVWVVMLKFEIAKTHDGWVFLLTGGHRFAWRPDSGPFLVVYLSKSGNHIGTVMSLASAVADHFTLFDTWGVAKWSTVRCG
jgi:hypothetical protein